MQKQISKTSGVFQKFQDVIPNILFKIVSVNTFFLNTCPSFPQTSIF